MFSLKLDQILWQNQLFLCPCTFPLYFKYGMEKIWRRSRVTLPADTEPYLSWGQIQLFPQWRLHMLCTKLCLCGPWLPSHSPGECKIRLHSLPLSFPYDSVCRLLFRPAKEWAHWNSNQIPLIGYRTKKLITTLIQVFILMTFWLIRSFLPIGSWRMFLIFYRVPEFLRRVLAVYLCEADFDLTDSLIKTRFNRECGLF